MEDSKSPVNASPCAVPLGVGHMGKYLLYQKQKENDENFDEDSHESGSDQPVIKHQLVRQSRE